MYFFMNLAILEADKMRLIEQQLCLLLLLAMTFQHKVVFTVRFMDQIFIFSDIWRDTQLWTKLLPVGLKK